MVEPRPLVGEVMISPKLVHQARPSLSPSREVREGLADIISMHEMLTNQFHSENVTTLMYKDY